ncbi:universal stress protein family protein [Kribbella steppae]|uniref:Universal stress protein family protein n=1 Tax=Kribbella steppae TaxID=2512223 RepID=A0A4R2H4E9_9ACTN|nr:universal stress protein [Kribbella steppae]TCO20326.1 universal stress protein family protein [Kribbella steppae]
MSEQPATVVTVVPPELAGPVVVVPDGWDPTQVQGLIVVGVSASAASQEAVGCAFEAAATRGAELILVHVLDDVPAGSGGIADQPWYPAARRLVSHALDGWADKFPAVTFRTHYRRGDPAEVLARYSRATDLLVIGGPLSTPLGMSLRERSRCPIVFAGGR